MNAWFVILVLLGLSAVLIRIGFKQVFKSTGESENDTFERFTAFIFCAVALAACVIGLIHYVAKAVAR